MTSVALISCVKTKLPYKAKARDMYISPLFKYSLKYVEKILKPNKTFILSAKYHLLELEQEIDTYEKTLKGSPKEEKQKWSEEIINQLSKKCNINVDKIFILAGRDYYKYLIKHLSNYEIIMEKLNMYERIPWLKGQLNG